MLIDVASIAKMSSRTVREQPFENNPSRTELLSF